MDNRYYGTVIGEMSPFFEEQGLKADGDIFKNDKIAVKVSYDEPRQVYKLFTAVINEGKIGDFEDVGSYLFDDSQTEKDAEGVGIDFVDTLKKKLGVKGKKRSGLEVELPSANKGGSVTITTLTSKLLAVYPALKDVYKEEVDKKGKYLYLDFMTTYFVPEIRQTLENANRKTVKKLMDMLAEMFVQGNGETSTAVAVILAAAIGKNEARFRTAAEHLADCQHLINAANNLISLLGKDKKFTEAVKYQD